MWRSDGVRFLVLRRRLRLTQEELARQSGVSRRVIGLIEGGNWETVRFGKLARGAEALGAKLYPHLTWQGERLERLVDAGHAELQNAFAGILRSLGWIVAVEVSFNNYGDRGRHDIVAFHPATAIMLVVEIKTGIGDVQATLGTLDVKARMATRAAQELAWELPAAVVPALVIADERNQHRIVAHHSELFARFALRGRAARAWLRQPKRGVSGLLMYVPLTDVRIVGVRNANRGQRVRVRPSTSTIASTAAKSPPTGRPSAHRRLVQSRSVPAPAHLA